MADIQNARDLLLQAASPRIVPVAIPIDKVEGLKEALKRIEITASAPSFSGAAGTTSPASITLTAALHNGLAGAVSWSLASGSATLAPSGLTCAVQGSSVVGSSVTVRASVTEDGRTYTGQITLAKYGALSAADRVNLAQQVTGQLAMGNVTGYGALALLNTVNLNTQTTGALNGQTQVTNLGSLAYANSIAANQIGAGQLAAGVIYAGSVDASQISAGIITGRRFRSAVSGARTEILTLYDGNAPDILSYDSTGDIRFRVSPTSSPATVFAKGSFGGAAFQAEADSFASSGIAAIQARNTGVGPALLAINTASGPALTTQAGTGPDLKLTPRSSLPAAVAGGIAYHSTHKFIFSDGSGWFKPTWTAV